MRKLKSKPHKQQGKKKQEQTLLKRPAARQQPVAVYDLCSSAGGKSILYSTLYEHLAPSIFFQLGDDDDDEPYGTSTRC